MGKKYLFFTLLGVAVVGVVSYLNRQRKLLSSFGYKLTGVTYLGTKNNITQLELKIKFTNTADFNIKVKGYKFDVVVDGSVIAKSSDNTVYNIPAKESITMPIIANADTNLSLSVGIATLVNQFVNSSAINATLRGNLDIQAGLVTINNLPVEFSATTKDIIKNI